MKISNEKKVLLKNTIMLYVLRFSVYFFAFITVPYQTRILGSESYGKLGIAGALMAYFQIIVDFGFILSATEEVSKNREDKAKLSEIYTSVFIAKLGLSVLSALILAIIMWQLPSYQDEPMLYVVFLLATVSGALLPDFIYRGLEDMSLITYRTIGVRIIFTLLIFVFLHDSSQYVLIPLLNFVGNMIALGWSMWDIRKRFDISLIPVSRQQVFSHFRQSGSFFLSRVASTVYSTINVLLLGEIGKTADVGNYTAADKLISTGKSGIAPIADSVYPYMTKHKDFKLIKRILTTVEPVIVVGCLIVAYFSEPLCVWLFGEEFRASSRILVAMMPVAILTLPNYLLGFPTLSAVGATKHANYSIYVGLLIHIIGIVVLSSLKILDVYTLTWLMSLTAFVETAYRFVVVWIKLKGYHHEQSI